MNKQSVHFSNKTVEWSTPQELFDALHRRFGFTLDVCARRGNAKCPRFFTREMDGLAQDWTGERCWMNPPYGREIAKWVKKAHESTLAGALVFGLLPARPDTAWWHEHVRGRATVEEVQGRLKFGGNKNSAPFPSVLVLWWGQEVLTQHHGDLPF